MSFFKVVGFVNFQCFIDDKNKKIYWTDLNLRISGGIDFAIQSNPYFFETLINCLENKRIKKFPKLVFNKKNLK